MSWHFITASYTSNSSLTLFFRFHFWEHSCANAKARRDISERSILKGTLGSGCHLLHGPGFPLARLRGTRLARPIPNALAKINSLIFIPGKFLIVSLFLPTLAAYLIDFAIVCTTKCRHSSALGSYETRTKVCAARCERSQVRLLNDPSRLNRNCMRNFIKNLRQKEMINNYRIFGIKWVQL